MSKYKVHVAFGFHVNCYHSYRGDTNDKFGFGSDIRIMRNILKALDKFNEENVDVKGTWDIENAYSVEKILPEYAMDIITGIKTRAEKNKDEVILMSYNNGAQSAQTHDEFKASLDLAITNKKKSGLKDVFKTYAPIIRPQEVMMNPYDASIYKECGIEAICLYYAYNSFDGFKNCIKPLEDAVAYYPLKYVYDKNSLTIIPMISQMDLIDLGSLKYLAYKLHDQQERGIINHDLLIYINMDADSFFWEKMPLPGFLTKMPNFGGLEGLVNEVKDLDFIKFDTPYNFLKSHKPVTEITFGEDIADGNFAGYTSWSEKPFNRLIYTRLEKARFLGLVNKGEDSLSNSFDTRVKLLSTTHFGLATPVLNISREKRALELSSQALKEEVKDLPKEDKYIVRLLSEEKVFSLQIGLEDNFLDDSKELVIKGGNIVNYFFVPLEYYPTHYVKQGLIYAEVKSVEDTEFQFELKDRIKKQFKVTTSDIIVEGKKIDFASYINYANQKIRFSKPEINPVLSSGNGSSYALEGLISLPEEVESGSYRYVVFNVPFLKGTGVTCLLHYPYTKELSQINSQASSLGRYTDKKWIEACPFEIKMDVIKDALIRKSNFRDQISAYPLDDFEKANKDNSSRDSFNNQLTGGLLNVDGLKISNLRQVASSMAYCPMRTVDSSTSYTLFLNPFGTYYGKQPNYISVGNGCGQLIYSAMAPQVYSLAPSYNGAKETFSLFLSLSEAEQRLNNLSKGAVLLSPENSKIHMYHEDNASFHASVASSTKEDDLKKVPSEGTSKKAMLSLVHLYLSNQRRAKKELKRFIKADKKRRK